MAPKVTTKVEEPKEIKRSVYDQEEFEEFTEGIRKPSTFRRILNYNSNKAYESENTREEIINDPVQVPEWQEEKQNVVIRPIINYDNAPKSMPKGNFIPSNNREDNVYEEETSVIETTARKPIIINNYAKPTVDADVPKATNANESEITYHNEVSIAYNNTHVTNLKDFIPCVVTKTDPEHDLAIIQLKDKKTPTDKYVFVVPENDPLEEYSFMDKMKEDKNSKLFMSSFNLGPSLALTKEGIISQFNSGAISQKTTDRIMYSIPTLPGSSGSPVINHQGELVAVNFAGLNGTQNFNYGVRIKFLQELINK